MPGADQPMRVLEDCISSADALSAIVSGHIPSYDGFAFYQDFRRQVMVIRCDGAGVYETLTLIADIWPSDNCLLPGSPAGGELSPIARLPLVEPRTQWAHLLDDEDYED